MVEITLTSTSPEADIIRQIEVLIRKMAVRQASSADVQLLHDLQRQSHAPEATATGDSGVIIKVSS
jgi:hypothetical protein